MFEDFRNLAKMMGNARELGAKLEQMRADLARRTVEADAGAGAVRVTVNGLMEVVAIRLDPIMLAALAGEGADTDRQMIEELLASAVNAALAKARDLVQAETARITGLPNLPGLSAPPASQP